jgi:transposase
VRHRAKLVGLRTCLKNQVHAVLAAAGVQVPMTDLFGVGGRELLAATRLRVESRSRVDSLLRVITALDFEIDTFARLVAGRLRTDPGYQAIQAIPGVGPSWPRCSSPRSATSAASTDRSSWPPGPG